MRNYLLFGISLLLFVACSGNKDQVEGAEVKSLDVMKTELKNFEDSLKLKKGIASDSVAVVYAEKCLRIAEVYPKSEEAPACIDKAHVVLASVGLHRRSVIIADSLVTKYPQYKNKLMVLESLASSYDIFIQPRDKNQVKKYYELMLSEFPDMPKEQKEQIEKRLKFVDLSFEEYIMQQN